MLEDRYYIRQSPFDARRSATVILLCVNVAVFFVQLAVEQFTRFSTGRYLALSLNGLAHGWLWQLFTYQFLHAGPVHLFFNCWAIYVFGHDVEDALSRKSYLTLYLGSGVVGGLFQTLAGLLLGGYHSAPVVGASAAAFGLVAAYAMLFPDRQILLFFILPLRAKYLLILSALLALYGILRPGDGIAHAAHLGGMFMGFFFVRYAIHWHWQWPRFRRPQAQATRRLVKVGTGGSGLWGRGKNDINEDMPPDEFLSREVDPILDKISAHGIQSLTARERRILEAARERMGKR